MTVRLADTRHRPGSPRNQGAHRSWPNRPIPYAEPRRLLRDHGLHERRWELTHRDRNVAEAMPSCVRPL